jgi:hypothetical protein
VRELGAIEGDQLAALISADLSGSGIERPRLSARLKIPAQAFGLKKYCCGTGPASKTSDNEHATTTLGDSEETSVKSSPRVPIAEFGHAPEEGAKVPSLVTR